jgi:hypothetical protein
MDAGRRRLTAESERETSSPRPSLLCASIDASEKVDDGTSAGNEPETRRDERPGNGPGAPAAATYGMTLSMSLSNSGTVNAVSPCAGL